MKSRVQDFAKNRPKRPWIAQTPISRWPVLLGVFDTLAIVLAVLFVTSVPVELRLIFVIVAPLILALGGMYARRLRVEALDHLGLTVFGITFAAMTVVTVDFMWLLLPVPRSGITYLWLFSLAAVLLGRLIAPAVYRLMIRSVPRRRTLIVGSGFAAVLVAEKIESHPELDLGLVGFVDEGPRKSVRGRHEPLLGGLSELSRIIEEQGIEVVILGYTVNNTKDILGALYLVEPKVEVLMMPRFFEFVSAGMKVDDLAGMPLLRLNRRKINVTERWAKRTEDLLIGGVASLLILPFVPFIAAAIKLDSPGPVFFKQDRVGKDGKIFSFYKFRTMTDGGEDASQPVRDRDPERLTAKDGCDQRVTRVGKWLRKFSIDELPQLYNVMKGDMSLVGPRPALPHEVAEYEEWQRKRLSVMPGITGMWQVSGRSNLPFDEYVWLDFMYIDSWSVWLDLRIILMTIPAVISARGAY